MAVCLCVCRFDGANETLCVEKRRRQPIARACPLSLLVFQDLLQVRSQALHKPAALRSRARANRLRSAGLHPFFPQMRRTWTSRPATQPAVHHLQSHPRYMARYQGTNPPPTASTDIRHKGHVRQKSTCLDQRFLQRPLCVNCSGQLHRLQRAITRYRERRQRADEQRDISDAGICQGRARTRTISGEGLGP